MSVANPAGTSAPACDLGSSVRALFWIPAVGLSLGAAATIVDPILGLVAAAFTVGWAQLVGL
jgi:hypothetical protein